MVIASVAALLFPLLLVVAGTGDVLSRRISNRLILLIVSLFFPLSWAAGMPMTTMLAHTAAGAGLLAAGFALFSFRFIGGGDAKLLAVTGLWFGPDALAPFLIMTVAAGGLLAFVVLAWAVVSLDAELRGSVLSRRISWLKPSVPYGYAIAAGALFAFSESWWGRAFTH